MFLQGCNLCFLVPNIKLGVCIFKLQMIPIDFFKPLSAIWSIQGTRLGEGKPNRFLMSSDNFGTKTSI
jgi:hypothetical protein